ncbi:MAG: ATP-binding cassette domain-containing protein [Clostridia bacterium]|nr:ATP-binding cassette domain-containing protein [Clostridia bacterium]
MANLKLSGVSKIYPSGKMALFNVSFSSSDGELIAITGGASSGKSTLLRIIAGLEECTAGDIYIGDKQVNDVDPKERDVAMIFRSNTLYPSLTVSENMAYGLKMRNFPSAVIEQRVKAAAQILGLSEVLYRKPKALTATQRQLTTYGRAIVREPKLYLLDDPLSGLDPKMRTQMRNVLINLQVRMKGTFLYATKNIAEAMSVATRIVVLKEGFVQQIDTPQNLYDYPANAYVGFFVGSPTMNLIQNAVVVKEEDGVYALFDDKKLKLSDKTISRWTNINEYIGTDKKVILGIRPEDITPDGEGAQLQGTVCGTDTTAELKLAEIDISKNNSLTVLLDGAVKGETHGVLIDTNRLYVFDADTQLTLLARDEGYVADTKNTEADFVPLTKGETEERQKQFAPPEKPAKKKR